MHQPMNQIKFYPELEILLPVLSAQENEWWMETKQAYKQEASGYVGKL